MKVAVFSAKPYDKKYLAAAAPSQFELTYHDVALTPKTAALLSDGEADALCAFVNDQLPAEVLDSLYAKGVRAILMRCAGFNNVDIGRAEKLGMFVAHVPAYSPEAVAEFAVALVQTINRKTHRAYMRVREGNFALDGLLGRTLHGKTVGLIGTGRIGIAFARIMKGYGCRLLAYDPYPSKAFEEYGEYTTLEDLIPQSDIISLHCPLTEQTRHIISSDTLALLRPGAIMVNTSRGGLVDTRAAIEALKSRKLGGLALDVYEGEGALFYDDHSGDIIQDDELMRLMTFPNVVVCGHQAFFTEEALTEIAECTMRNLEDFASGRECKHALVKGRHADAPKPVEEEEAAEEGDATTVPDRRPIARRDSLPVRTV
ncbi:D-lactate dehydrogenase [Plectosphaerella cucumerina]|uniref:D-lactate dehydrogenase n=1 Tax=Plectosphaerella cucumerina TaxID=40658 RepID=A0A8K0X7G3_9PEZI|nr:D-lactate dehydrogenase [Plectosphaerella cucumerina]